mgnify:CR=1 FL=1
MNMLVPSISFPTISKREVLRLSCITKWQIKKVRCSHKILVSNLRILHYSHFYSSLGNKAYSFSELYRVIL